MLPTSPYRPHETLITFVTDWPGHDRRYAMDTTKIRRELGWEPRETLRAVCARRFRGISRTGGGGSRFGRAGTEASGWARASITAPSNHRLSAAPAKFCQILERNQ